MDTRYDWHKAVRTTDPDTSVEAAKSMRGISDVQYDKIVRTLLASCEPLAAEQLSDVIGEDVWRRMSELERDGVVRKTTLRHTNRSGRQAIKYELC